VEVEDVAVGVGHLGQVAAGGVQDALRLPGGSGGVEDEQRVLGVDGLRRVVLRRRADRVVPPHVALVVPGDVLSGALDDQHVLHGRRLRHRLVHRGLERRRRAAPVAAVRGDHQLGLGVLDPAA
jgi:hypothetical protein